MLQKLPAQKIRLVARIGVIVDHPGPSIIAGSIAQRIEDVLTAIKNNVTRLCCHCNGLYASDEPHLRLISSLGGNAELFLAREAIHRGFELHCLLPMEREAHKVHFPSDTLRQIFEELYQRQAKSKIELDGSVDYLDLAREAADQAILLQSDLLIFVCESKNKNLEPPQPKGVLLEAISRNIPVLWIDDRPNHEPFLYEKSENQGAPPKCTAINQLLDRLKPIFLLQPQIDSQPLLRFLAEKQPRPIPLHKWFRNFFARGWEKHLDKALPELSGSDDRWDSLESPNGCIGYKIRKNFGKHLKRTDNLANIYGDIYRSIFVLTYGLGVLAVIAAFFGFESKNSSWFVVELLIILCILVSVWLGNRFHVHERWSDYRLLAEGFRQMQFLAPLARVTPAFEVPAYLGDDPGRTWFNWYFRAVIREVGLISAKLDTEFLSVYRLVLLDAVSEQVWYHGKTCSMMEVAHRRLHQKLVRGLFITTLLVCVLHLAMPQRWMEDNLIPAATKSVEFLLSLLAIALPATGAAFEGIAHQGEFDRIGRRSKALRARLSAFLSQLSNPDFSMSAKELGNQAEHFCLIQLLEQADWRAAFVSRPLSPP